MKTWLGAGLLLGLAACSGSQEETSDSAAEVELYQPTAPYSDSAATETTATTTAEAPPPPPPPPPVQGRAAAAPPPARPSPQPNTPPQGAPLLAYRYGYSVEAPPAGVRTLLRRHEQACQTAGPAVCQTVGATSEQHGERELSARLEFRATPAYVARFRAGVEREVEAARGEVTSNKVETEDLTRSIIDTEARLRAGRLLRTRLEALIASRPGNLEQLLEIERELARVQGELDAAESTLAVMRARVQMSTVLMEYASRGAVADPGDARPLAEAGDSFARNLAASSAAILTFVSVILPWAVLLGLLGWLVAWLARRNARRGGRKTKPAPAAPPPPPPADFGGPNRPGG